MRCARGLFASDSRNPVDKRSSRAHYHIFLIARQGVKDPVCYRLREDKCPLGDWYRDLDSRSRARADTVLRLLIASSNWSLPWFQWLSGARYAGIGEIYVRSALQHRLLCCAASPTQDRMVILTHCYHKDRVYTPPSALETARDLRGSYLQGLGRIYPYEQIFTVDE